MGPAPAAALRVGTLGQAASSSGSGVGACNGGSLAAPRRPTTAARRRIAARPVTGLAAAPSASLLLPRPLCPHRRRPLHAAIHALTGVHGQPSDNGSGTGSGAAAASTSGSSSLEAAAVAAAADAAAAAAAAGGSGAGTAGAHQQREQAAAPPSPSPSPPPPSPPASPAPGGRPSSNFIKRVTFGVILGFGAAAIIIHGRLPFLATTMFVVYQATQEYFGIVTSKGISRGVDAPPPLVSAVTTVLCLSITLTTYLTGIKSGTAMCVAAFLLLVLNVIGNQKPTFSQLTSSVFGLFYCGGCFRLGRLGRSVGSVVGSRLQARERRRWLKVSAVGAARS
jgi:hypothetical protein